LEEEIGLDFSRIEHVTTTVNHTPEEPTGKPTLSTLGKTSTGEATVEMEPEQTFNEGKGNILHVSLLKTVHIPTNSSATVFVQT